MKLLIVGCGSIGLKHLHTLQALKVSDIQVIEPNDIQRQKSHAIVGKKHAHRDWGDVDPFDAAIICTPTSRHVEDAMTALEYGANIIIEKPVSHRMEDGDKLIAAAKDHVALVACPMRFHPGFRAIHQEISEGKLGDVFYARAWYKQALPEWRPGTDYRTCYSSKAAQGGGLFYDRIHELDALRTLFGEPYQVRAGLGSFGTYPDIDVEECANGIMVMRGAKGDTICEVDLDMVSPGYSCGMVVVGKSSSLLNYAPQVEGMSVQDHWKAAYDAEMRHWLACLHGVEEPVQPLPQAYRVLQTAIGLYVAAETGGWVNLEQAPVQSAA